MPKDKELNGSKNINRSNVDHKIVSFKVSKRVKKNWLNQDMGYVLPIFMPDILEQTLGMTSPDEIPFFIPPKSVNPDQSDLYTVDQDLSIGHKFHHQYKIPEDPPFE